MTGLRHRLTYRGDQRRLAAGGLRHLGPHRGLIWAPVGAEYHRPTDTTVIICAPLAPRGPVAPPNRGGRP